MPQFDHVTLRTDRLILRPLREEDAADLFAIFSDPGVTRYWATPPWDTLQAAHESIASASKAMANGESLRLGIECQATGRLIGTCSLFSFVEQCKRAELGYALARRAHPPAAPLSAGGLFAGTVDRWR